MSDPTGVPLDARRLRSVESAADHEHAGAAPADTIAGGLAARIEAFEEQLHVTRREAARLAASLAQQEGQRRAAEQRAHAERALRLDLEQELAAYRCDDSAGRLALGELAAGEQVIRDLEHELEGLRRRADEAQQLAAAAAAARVRAERRADEIAQDIAQAAERAAQRAPGDLQRPGPALTRSLRLERELVAQRARGQPLADRVTSEHELAELRAELDGARSALQRETAARTRVELRAAELERELAAQCERSGRAYDAIEDLRATLDGLSALRVPPPTTALALGRLAAPTTGPAASRVEPERLNEAFSRLRETIPLAPEPAPPEPTPEGVSTGPAAPMTEATPTVASAPEPTPAVMPTAASAPEATLEPVPIAARPEPELPRGPAKAWLFPVFKTLVATDAARAGRLLLDLLPAQAAAYPRPVSYDLVLGEPPGYVQVTVRRGESPEIRFANAARERGEVDFQAIGDPARLARLLTVGPLRRRLGWGVARVRGERRGLAALRALIGRPLYLSELHAAGVRIDAVTAMTVVALMIDDSWTAGERFTLALAEGEGGATLTVHDGAPLRVSAGAAAEPATTTIVGSADALLVGLTGGPPDGLSLRGDERPLALVREWLERAQSG